MAIDRVVAVAFRPRRDRRVLLYNLEDRFPSIEFELSDTIPPGEPGEWGNYSRAAGQALWREIGPLSGLEGIVDSTVPVAAGLSSSSALVVATALALLDATGAWVERGRLAEILARGERYVGLQGGGMDQTVSLCASGGHALRIGFRPALEITPVPFPADWRVVIASSMVEAAKAAGTRDAYNDRVRECREALARFAAAHSPESAPADYAELLGRWEAGEAIRLAEGTLDDVLFRRFRHVVSEGARVAEAVAAMRAGDLAWFGELLSASHTSLRDDYAVSCAELDELVGIAEAAGAAGARLTGAGFGGCIVAATRAEQAEGVMHTLWRDFYRPRSVPSRHRNQLVFLATAAGGARLEALPEGRA
jgi:galactokinase